MKPADGSESKIAQSKNPLVGLDIHLIKRLETMAQKEGKTTAELLHELLDESIERRSSADAWLKVWKSLAPREKQVASLTCLGFTNDEIGRQMSISSNTVKTYVKKILSHFNLRSKIELRGCLEDWDFSDWVEKNIN